ncbi:hypothetical protein Tco_0290214 [Tanacetum coccineum]
MLGFITGKTIKEVLDADSIIESLPSDAWNTVPASSKRLKDEMLIHKWNIDVISVPNSHVLASSDFHFAQYFRLLDVNDGLDSGD